ncbi:MAG: hypothetical protein H6701_14975 [Myxococcales bacterium]|nr:hypothetical protein [Myxococcales bacterium]
MAPRPRPTPPLTRRTLSRLAALALLTTPASAQTPDAAWEADWCAGLTPAPTAADPPDWPDRGFTTSRFELALYRREARVARATCDVSQIDPRPGAVAGERRLPTRWRCTADETPAREATAWATVVTSASTLGLTHQIAYDLAPSSPLGALLDDLFAAHLGGADGYCRGTSTQRIEATLQPDGTLKPSEASLGRFVWSRAGALRLVVAPAAAAPPPALAPCPGPIARGCWRPPPIDKLDTPLTVTAAQAAAEATPTGALAWSPRIDWCALLPSEPSPPPPPMAGSYGFDAIDGSSITLALVGEDGHERDRARCTVYLGFPSALPPDREWTGVALADWQCLTGADNTPPARRTRVDTLVPARGRQDAARARHWQIDLRPGTPGGALLTDLFVAPNHLGAICHGVGLDAIRADWALGPRPKAPRVDPEAAPDGAFIFTERGALRLVIAAGSAYAPTPSPPPLPIPPADALVATLARAPAWQGTLGAEAMHLVLSSTTPTAEGTLRTAIGERPCRALLVDRALVIEAPAAAGAPGLHCRLTLADDTTLTGPCHAIPADGTLAPAPMASPTLTPAND